MTGNVLRLADQMLQVIRDSGESNEVACAALRVVSLLLDMDYAENRRQAREMQRAMDTNGVLRPPPVRL
jgi:hypothetical protein